MSCPLLVILPSPYSLPLNANADDYSRIAAAIEFIQHHQAEQPDLAAIARHIHLSEHHCQKLFSRWAGVSPKRFLQFVTLEYAKRRLQDSRSLGKVTLDAGLSSPSRLHDHFVKLEAMSPGEYRAGGAGLTIHYGIHPTRFGLALIATTVRGVCGLHFLDGDDRTPTVEDLRDRWPQAEIVHAPGVTQGISDRLNQGLSVPPDKPLPLLVKGTNFQIQVWRALLELPSGSLATYQDIAQAIGKPRAVRAVGTAIGVNPVAYFIPCHRVIRRTGALGGYRWGLVRKSTILGWEASQLQENHETAASC